MRKLFGVCAIICLLGCFAWVGGIETERLDFGLGAFLLVITVVAFGFFALAAQSYTEAKK